MSNLSLKYTEICLFYICYTLIHVVCGLVSPINLKYHHLFLMVHSYQKYISQLIIDDPDVDDKYFGTLNMYVSAALWNAIYLQMFGRNLFHCWSCLSGKPKHRAWMTCLESPWKRSDSTVPDYDSGSRQTL